MIPEMAEHMSPRRSPRLKEKEKYRVDGPELPRKPRRPKRVKNAAEDSVRQANFQAELAAWQVAQQEHADLMKIRKREKTAAWKAAQKAPPQAAPPAAPPAALAPPSRLGIEFPELGAVLVQLYLDEHGAPIVPLPPRWGPGSRAVRFHGLRRSIVQWVLDVEAVARRCGAGDAQPLHPDGDWYDADEYAEKCGGVPGRSPPEPRLLTCARAAVQDSSKCCLSTSERVDLRRIRPSSARSSSGG